MTLEDVYQRNLHHRTHRAGWLRAAVLGANDGLVSTASLMIGVAAARSEQSFLVTAGAAGIAAGAMSMAVGEYVSVRSQNDIEESDRLLEIEHLALDPEGELEELIEIYINRGLSRELATEVATTMHAKDPLEAHLRDELGQRGKEFIANVHDAIFVRTKVSRYDRDMIEHRIRDVTGIKYWYLDEEQISGFKGVSAEVLKEEQEHKDRMAELEQQAQGYTPTFQ